jgi:hypothetical protein
MRRSSLLHGLGRHFFRPNHQRSSETGSGHAEALADDLGGAGPMPVSLRMSWSFAIRWARQAHREGLSTNGRLLAVADSV